MYGYYGEYYDLPWYHDLANFAVSPYGLPFTATFVVLILMLTFSFISTFRSAS